LIQKINLLILKDNLTRLSSTPYFNKGLTDFVRNLLGAVEFVINNFEGLPPLSTDIFVEDASIAYTYLASSTTREIPYEMEFCLNVVLKDWISQDYKIATSLTNAGFLDFHFQPLDMAEEVKRLFGYTMTSSSSIIHIGMPRLYKTTPLLNIPLYHELGHFIDRNLGIVNLAIFYLQNGHFDAQHYPELPVEMLTDMDVSTSHIREYFADLFATSYIGTAHYKFLDSFAGYDLDSRTHPATFRRVQLCKDYMSGTDNIFTSLFNFTLVILGHRPLSLRFSVPNLKLDFDNVRPHDIKSDAEMHGFFSAAWDYLDDNISILPLQDRQTDAIIKNINGLTEKSIRNYSIVNKWRVANGTT